MKKTSPKQFALALHDATLGKSVGESEKIVKSFVALLSKKRMLGKSSQIISDYKKISQAEKGIVEAIVTTSHPLSDSAEEKIKTFIKKEFQAKDVEIHHKLEESLLGGMKLKVGDTIIDSTLRGRLKEMETALTK